MTARPQGGGQDSLESRTRLRLEKLFEEAGLEIALRLLIVWLTKKADGKAYFSSTLDNLKAAYESYAIRNGRGPSYRMAQMRLEEALEALK